MAKISNEDRHQYHEKIKPYQAVIHALLKREEAVRHVLKSNEPGVALKRLAMAEEMISLTANYIIMSGISQSVLKQRSEEALNDARKSIYKAVIYMEEVVSPSIDAPFSDYEDKLAEISTVDAQKRYNIIKKMGLAIQLLENAYGDKTKWRWAFVELEGRFAAISKNIMNLKTAVANTDPSAADYEPTMYHLKLMKKLLLQAADRYREKYELSTNRFDDFKMGINFLNSLRRIHALLGERGDAETLKKKADIWSSKLEVDTKKQEEAAKRL
ncbi:MAG: hypothetical protein LBH42_09745 [Treponema sp.]|jgi:hypothetical protein|nr:hypothetical protein [Treponema sp.]